MIKKYNIYPKIYEANVKEYIDLFQFEENKSRILECNKIMEEYLKNNLEV